MGRSTQELIQEATDKAQKAVEAAVEHAQQFTQPQAPVTPQTAEEAPAQETPAPELKPQDKPTPQEMVTPTPPPVQEVKAEDATALAAELAQVKSNYDHLRSYADRVSGENSDLRRENDDLRRQIQILLSAKPAGEAAPASAPVSGSPTGEPAPADVIPPPAGTISPESDQRKVLRQELEELAGNFPEVLSPVLKYLDAMEASVQSELGKVKPVFETIVEDTRNRARTNLQAEIDRAHAEIEKCLPGWKNLVFLDPANPLESAINPDLERWLTTHPDGYLYSKMLFPDVAAGERGATPSSVARILAEFKESVGAPAAARIDAAAQDAQTLNNPKPLVPNSNLSGDPIERLKAGGQITHEEMQKITATCRGDALMWSQTWPLVNKAIQERRIIYTGAFPGNLYG